LARGGVEDEILEARARGSAWVVVDGWRRRARVTLALGLGSDRSGQAAVLLGFGLAAYQAGPTRHTLPAR